MTEPTAEPAASAPLHGSPEAAPPSEPPAAAPPSQPAATARTGLGVLLLLAVVLAAVTGGVFAGGLENDFVWDDHTLIQHNRHIREPESLGAVLTRPFWATSSRGVAVNPVYAHVYRPVVSAAYIAQFQVFGDDPAGFHAVSIVLHMATVLLVWLVLRLRLRASVSTGELPAFLGALVFAVHPSRPESVSWISGSTDVWMMFFVALGVLLWLSRRHLVHALLAALAFVVALGAKETAVVVPVLLFVDEWLAGRLRASRRDLIAVGAVVGAGLVLRLSLVPVGGAGKLSFAPEVWVRALSTLGHYVLHTVWPWAPSVTLGARHTDEAGAMVLEPGSLVAGGVFVALLVVLAALSLRSARVRPWLSDALWFLLPLGPVLNFLDLGAIGLAATRFVYFPVLGFASAVGHVADAAIRRGAPLRGPVLAILVTFLAGAATISFAHTRHFKDDTALWLYELDLDPQHVYVLSELATIAKVDDRPDRAADLLHSAYKVALGEGNPWMRIALAARLLDELMAMTAEVDQTTLGHIRDSLVRVAKEPVFAYRVGEYAVNEPMGPALQKAFLRDAKHYRVPRATALLRTGALAQAEKELRATLAGSGGVGVSTVLIWAVARQGKWEEAERLLVDAERRMPGHRGLVSVRKRLEQARQLAGTAPVDETSARVQAARVAMILGAFFEARRRAEELLAASPGHFEFAMLAAEVEAADRQFERAEAIVRRAQALGLEPEKPWDRALGFLAASAERTEFHSRVWSDQPAAPAPAAL